jgi:type II secretory pathway pseudopilin PulG
MKRYFATLVIVLAGLAYLVGYWPEHQRRQALEGQVTSLRAELAEAQARVRLGGLLGQLLAAEDAVSAQNYGQAQALSSKFFDAVRAEATRPAAGSFNDALEKVVRMRDPVTASLTRGDPQALTLLGDAETLVRNALGFPRPATP